MKTLSYIQVFGILAALGLAGCASSNAPDRGGATLQGAPRPIVSQSVMDKAAIAGAQGQPASRVVIAPDQLVAPGTYRLLIVDGQTVLVRETDPRKILTSPAVQIVATDPMSTDLAIQPALLPQEVTEEIVKNRAQTDEALRTLPQLMAQVNALKAEQKRLTDENTELLTVIRQAVANANANQAAQAAAAAAGAAKPQGQTQQ
jgi:hypothetical protein